MNGQMTKAGEPMTVSRIAAELDEPRHRIEHIIETRMIRPIAWAGNARIFDRRDLDRVKAELDRIDAEREGGAL